MALVNFRGCPSRTEVKDSLVKGSVYLGLFFFNMWSATTMFWGNLSVYTSSYFYSRVYTNGEVIKPWAVAFFLLCWSTGMIVSKSLFDRIGKRLTGLIGVSIFNGSIFLSYFAVQYSSIALDLTMGVGVGFGCGIDNSLMMVTAVEWADKYFGVAVSAMYSGVGVGSIFINQMITQYINPDNLIPDRFNGQVKYFSQDEIQDRVPQFFLVYGATSLSFSLIGLALLRTRETGCDVESTSSDGAYSTPKSNERNIAYTKEEDSLHEDAGKHVSFGATDFSEESIKGEQILERGTNSFSNKGITKRQISGMTDHTPIQMLKSFRFYVLTLSIMFTDLGYLVITTYYKSFGLLYISDDHLMTNIGTFLVSATAVCSLLSGMVSDKVNVKPSFVGSGCLLVMISSFYFFTPMLNKYLFGMATSVYAGLIYFNYNLFYLATLKLFGESYYSTNQGIATFSGIAILLLAPPVLDTIISKWGWFYVFFCVGFTNALSLLFVLFGFPSI